MSEKDDTEKKSRSHHKAAPEEAEDLLDQGLKAVTDTFHSAEAVYGDALKQVSQLVRKHPLEALAVGFGVGCLVGLALTRRR